MRAVARGNDFRDGGHADQVGADGAQIANFGGSFVAGTGQSGVDAFIEADVIAVAFADGHFAKAAVVRDGHVRKTQAEAFVVRASERAYALQIDVIFDDDELALNEFAFDAAGGVGKDNRFHAHTGEDANGEGDLFGGIAFVEMDAALHSGDRDVADRAEDELAGMADGSGLREIGDFRVGDFSGVLEFVGEGAEAGAEDQGDFGAEIRF